MLGLKLNHVKGATDNNMTEVTIKHVYKSVFKFG